MSRDAVALGAYGESEIPAFIAAAADALVGELARPAAHEYFADWLATRREL